MPSKFSQFTVRQARPEDAAEIARIHVDGWRARYPGMVPDEQLASLDYSEKEAMWRTTLIEKARPQWRMMVAVDENGRVAAWCTSGKRRDENHGTPEGEVHGLYAHPEFFGMGVGALLLQEALGTLSKQWKSIVVWVLTANYEAQNTYRRAGFKVIAENIALDEHPEYLQTLMRYSK
jgi:ribosomal protein S18 acetylase RimI-like enzyme